MKCFLSALLLAAARIEATAITPAKSCQEYTIPVTVVSTNGIVAFSPFKDNLDLVDFLTDFTSREPPIIVTNFVGNETSTASYTISATFCTPRNSSAPNKDTILLATHGLNFDRRYSARLLFSA
jgi:hypothetical protein